MQVIKASELDLMRTDRMPVKQVDAEAWRTPAMDGMPPGEGAPAREGVEGIVVQFAAGARTKWHSHPHGQVLFVLRGAGRIGTASEVLELHAGDVAVATANECHWHGASADDELVHLAVSLGHAAWSTDSVSADEYAGNIAGTDASPVSHCAEATEEYQSALRDLAKTIGQSVTLLSDSRSVRTASADLRKAVDDGDPVKASDAATDLLARLELIRKLTRAADDIDPHVLAPSELERLWKMEPTELIDDALREGKLRERRIMVEAKEAETNRRLARIAIGAAVGASLVALAVPLVERLVNG
jgi:quercetin dioxygenase-like cupin family protein